MTCNLIRALSLVALLGALLATVACERGPEKQPLTLDSKVSSNVMPPPEWWPREKMDFPEDDEKRFAMEAALAEHGRPDFLWFVHTFDRQPVLVQELLYPDRVAGIRPKPLVDWVYLDKDMVLTFPGAEPEQLELTDKIRTLCLYGDPNEIRPYTTPGGSQEPRWVYYVHGREFTFREDDLVSTYRFPPMPGFKRTVFE